MARIMDQYFNWQKEILGHGKITNTSIFVYATVFFVIQAIYCLYLDPLSKYPGPKLSVLYDFWWVYARLSGRYPWIIEDALNRYGDIVRISPRELVFSSPRAAKDTSQFVPVDYDVVDIDDDRIFKPIEHPEVRKFVATPSTKTSKAHEPIVHKVIDDFIKKMKTLEAVQEDIELRQLSDELASDLSSEMKSSDGTGQIQDFTDTILLSSPPKLNLWLTMRQVTRKFPVLSSTMWLASLYYIGFTTPKPVQIKTEDIKEAVKIRPEYWETLHYFNGPEQPTLGSRQPLANQLCSVMFFLLGNPAAYQELIREIRGTFPEYEEAITIESTSTLKYLQACIQESLRMQPDTVDSLPRVSPGALVDGVYIPQGVRCQVSYFAAARSPHCFCEPLEFHPERWLSPDDPRFDPRFKNDDLEAFQPFSQGLRGSLTLYTIRLFIAQVLWHFDLQDAPGQARVSFDQHFRFMTFWEMSPFWMAVNKRTL